MFKTKDGNTIDIQALTGVEIYEKLKAANPVLAQLTEKCFLEDIKCLGSDKIWGFQANYKFGEKIISNREVFLSFTKGGSISFNDLNLPDNLIDHLAYTPVTNNPVGIILNHEAEFFLPFKNHIVSYGTIKAGQILGYAHIMDLALHFKSEKPKKVFISNWDLNAGARLAFVLPQISENQKHMRMLKKYEIKAQKPSDFIEQCQVFKALNANVRSPWKQSVLYFSRHLLDHLSKDAQFISLHNALAGVHRSGYNIWHTSYPTWESSINKVLSDLDLNVYSSYALNIVKHLYLIAAGGAPGFVPATDEVMLPKKLIEKAYTESGYGLTESWPITMQPQLFNPKDNLPVYYGLKLPTLINYNPETFGGKTTIALLYEINDIISRCQKYILDKFEDKDSLLYETAKTVKFGFYHSDSEAGNHSNSIIKNSVLIPEEDSRFYKKGWNFPSLSPFVRGCIKIEPKT